MADLEEYKAQAQQQLAGAMPQLYEEAYRKRAMARFGQELPAAQSLLQGMQSGETSQALAAQRLGMGESAAQQAMMAASGASKSPGGIANPLAARQAMYGGAQAASGIAQQAASQRAADIGGARQAALEAQLRQVGYGQALEAEELRRRLMMQQAMDRLIGSQVSADAAETARNTALIQGALGAVSSAGAAAIKKDQDKNGA